MSTGHRPTFYPAKGKSEVSGGFKSRLISVKDQRGHTKLKFRQFGQASQSEMVARDFRAEIDAKEEQSLAEKNKGLLAITNAPSDKNAEPIRLLTDAPVVNIDEIKSKYDDADAVEGNSDDDLESR